MAKIMKTSFKIGWFLSLFALIPGFVLAANITATPLTFENELTFAANQGQTVNPAEVRINITGPAGKYEIRQELLNAPTNGQNQIDWQYFKIRGIRKVPVGGGTFYAGQDAPYPIRSFNPLYTNTGGAADNFVLIYYVDVPASVPSGFYRGRIKYVYAPLTSADQTTYAFLNIVVNVGAKSTAGTVQKPQIEVSVADGSNYITLNSQKSEKQACDVQINVNRRPNGLFSILQVMREPLISNQGDQIDYDAVKIATQRVKTGIGISGVTLSGQPQKIFTSGPGGEAPEAFLVTYSLGDLSGQTAGRYRSKVQYYLEQIGSAPVLLKTLDIQIEIGSIFELIITPGDQKNLIEFRDLKSGDQPKVSEITIEVKSNTGKQYQVNQSVYSALVNKAGEEIPADYFTVKTSKVDQELKGTLKFSNKAQVKKGDSALFVSDAQGSPAKFKVTYELGLPRDLNIESGDYSTRIVYSLTEL